MEDMTIGIPSKLILRFTVPLLLGNLFQQLYSFVDTIIVGRSLGMDALGAIGAVGSLTFFVQGFVLGIASGLSMVLAQRFGAKTEERIRSSFAASIWISLAVVLLLTVISILFSSPLLLWMNIPLELFANGLTYFRTTMLGLTVLMFFNLMCNVLRSKGDTTHLFFFTVLSQVLNIIFDIIFILMLHMGVGGVAYATILSQLIAGLFCYKYITEKLPLLKLRKKDWLIDLRELKLHWNISMPVGLQSSIISIGSIILQFKLNGLGTAAVEGHALGARMESMLTMPLVTFGVATATYTAQNYGAGKAERIWQGVRNSTIISMAYSAVVGLMLFFFGSTFAAAMFGVDSGLTLDYLDHYFKMTSLLYVVLSFLYIFRYCLQGMGKVIAPTIAGFMEMGMRSLIPLLFVGGIGFPAIVLSHPLAWSASLAVLTAAIVWVKKDDRSSRLKRFLTS